MKEKIINWLFIFLILIFIAGFSFIFLTTTSPVSRYYYGNDSAFFRVIGKEIIRGKSLYIDIWDHKGPILYLIQAIGALHGTRNEKISLIFVMELFSFFLSVYFMYKANKKIAENKFKLPLYFIIVVCTFTVLGSFLQGGNLSEDWSMPMICCSLYLFTDYAIHTTDDQLHPYKYAFFHGICLSLIAFIRINNAVTIIMGILVIAAYLVYKHQWENLYKNILFGLLGIAVITIPLFVWFGLKKAVWEMLYATFFFNIKYSEGSAISITGYALLLKFLPIAVSLVLELLYLLKSRKFRFIDVMITAIIIANTAFFLIINRFDHYFIIYVPVFWLTLILYTESRNIPSQIVLILVFSVYFNNTLNWGKYYMGAAQQPVFSTVNLYFPKSEKNSAIAINVSPEIYLNTGIEPCSRFVANQGGHFAVNPAFKQEFIETLREKKPLWIIGNCSADGTVPYAEFLPDLHYELKFNDSTYCFFRQTEAKPGDFN